VQSYARIVSRREEVIISFIIIALKEGLVVCFFDK